VTTPVLHLVVGPNGAGKTTFYESVLGPATGLAFINADRIAAARWPDDPGEHAYQAAELADAERRSEIAAGRSFATETVFSHPSRLDLLRAAGAAGYRSYLWAILVPEELAVQRVAVRVELGGHQVREAKVRSRYRRMWRLIREAIGLADEAEVLDNSRASTPFRPVARFLRGALVGAAVWPSWTPPDLR
jgi:predicted ABC-type ATPase